jgi:DNA-binding beta-propeller fold protein YncE
VHTKIARASGLVAGLLTLPLLSYGAAAQLLISSNDGKAVLINGVNTVPDKPETDHISIIDLDVKPPKVVAEIPMPTSLVGPPQSVAFAPDKSWAIVTAATKTDPTNPKKVVPNNQFNVVDLKSSPPKLVKTYEAGNGATGVAINKAGTLALITNRSEGTVSVYTISGKELTPAGKVDLGGGAASGPSAVQFTPDGKNALVTRDGDHKISVLNIDGTKVEHSKRDMTAGVNPYPLEISTDGSYAAISSVGKGQGDSDTVSLIDLKQKPARVVETISVGQTPETVSVSPDGKYVAVNIMNGTNKPKESPYRNENGFLKVYAVDKNLKLSHVAEAPVGQWCQGTAWNKSSNMVIVQCIVENDISFFDFDGKKLTKSHSIKVKGAPGGLGVAN